MLAVFVMFLCGYFFHLAYKFLDRVFGVVIDAVKSRKAKE